MNLTHSHTKTWGKTYRLRFWKWGVTLDWGFHRWIWTIRSLPQWPADFE